MFAYEISPYQRNAYHGYEPCNALHVSEMGGFDIEPRRLHGSEQRLNLPSFLISFYGLFWAVITNKDLKFGFTFGVKELCASEINILTFMYVELVIEKFPANTKTVEKMPGSDLLTRSGVNYPEVLTNTDVISYMVFVKPAYPVLANKFSVSHKRVDATSTEKLNELLHQFLAFLTVGVSSLRHELEKNREGNSLVGYAQHKNVNVKLAEFPVGAVHAQDKAGLYRQEAEYHLGDKVKVKNELRKETLQPSHVGTAFNIGRHAGRKFMKAHGLNHAEGMNHERHQFDAGKVDTISEMFFQDWQNLINFVRVLGVSKLHNEKRELFFKVTEFQGLLQY